MEALWWVKKRFMPFNFSEKIRQNGKEEQNLGKISYSLPNGFLRSQDKRLLSLLITCTLYSCTCSTRGTGD